MRTLYVLVLTILISKTCIGQTNPPKISITPLTHNFYIYTTYNLYEGNYIPAHGMYALTEKGAILFDTPWDTTQFQPLLDSIRIKHNSHVSICIATHWHSDRTEGLEYYKQQGIKTYTTILTDELSRKNNKKRAEFLMTHDTSFQIGNVSFEVFYPGEGHTADNITIWFNEQKILYGGCLIKGAEAKDLGYLGDANKNKYLETLLNLKKRYPKPKYIIVSHHDWRNTNSLKHSIKLARQLNKREN